GPATITEQSLDASRGPQLGHHEVDRPLGAGQRYVLLEAGPAEAPTDLHGRRQLVVRAGQDHQLLSARELAGRVVEAIVEALAELELELGDGWGLERAGQLERRDHGLIAALDAQALAAA